MKNSKPCIALFGLLFLAQCTTSQVQTAQSQSSTSPNDALQILMAGNERFASGRSLHRNLPAQVKLTAGGQHPVAAIVSCIDSRTSSELVFDQGMGDIFNARVAGNVINDDILGSLEFATSAAGAKLVLVVGHTRCGAVSGACKRVELGHLTGLLAKIRPAAARAKVSGAGTAGPGFEDAVAAENVRLSVEQIRKQSTILQTLESQGKIRIQGAMYHLDTGRVELLKP